VYRICRCFSKIYRSFIYWLNRHDDREDEIIGIDEVRKKYAKSVVINLNLDTVKENDVFELIKLIDHNQGKCKCFLNLSGSGLENNSIYLTRKYTVDPNRQFVDNVKKLLGPETVRVTG
jgi:hypothetical protein